MKSFFVKKAGVEDVESIVKIHKCSFEGYFLTAMGEEFLKQFYGEMFGSGGIVLMIFDEKKEPVGFITGVPDVGGFYLNILKNKFPSVLKSTIKGILKGRIKGKDVILRLYRLPLSAFKSFMKKKEEQYLSGHFEIMSIAILNKYRSSGAGSLLLRELLSVLKELNCITVGVSCRRDNRAALSFYMKHGFRKEGGTADVVHLTLRLA